MRDSSQIRIEGSNLSELKVFEKLPFQKAPLDWTGDLAEQYNSQSKLSAILNLILEGMPTARQPIMDIGDSIIKKLYNVEPGWRQVTTKEDKTRRVEPLFPNGRFRPFVEWEQKFKTDFPNDGLMPYMGAYRTAVNDMFERTCIAIATFAINATSLFKNEGLGGKSFATFQYLMVLNRESGWLDNTEVFQRAFPGASEELADVGAMFVRPRIGIYSDPTRAQAEAGEKINAIGPYSIRIGSFLHYLHDLGWKEANSAVVNASSVKDIDIMAWVLNAPLALQNVLSNAGADTAQRGDLPFQAADGRSVRTWSVTSTLKSAAWRSLFYGNPALRKLTFMPSSEFHNSPLYHMTSTIPNYMDRLFDLKARFRNYNSNYRELLGKLIAEAKMGNLKQFSGEVSAMQKVYDKNDEYLGWYAEVVQSGWRYIAGVDRTTTFEMLQPKYQKLFRDLPTPAEDTESYLYRSLTIDQRYLIDLLFEDDILSYDGKNGAKDALASLLSHWALKTIGAMIGEHADQHDLPESFYASIDEFVTPEELQQREEVYRERSEQVTVRLKSTGLIQYLDEIIVNSSDKDGVLTSVDENVDVSFQLPMSHLRGSEHSRQTLSGDDLWQGLDLQEPKRHNGSEPKLRVDLTEF